MGCTDVGDGCNKVENNVKERATGVGGGAKQQWLGHWEGARKVRLCGLDAGLRGPGEDHSSTLRRAHMQAHKGATCQGATSQNSLGSMGDTHANRLLGIS
jgi:hypothetical protein